MSLWPVTYPYHPTYYLLMVVIYCYFETFCQWMNQQYLSLEGPSPLKTALRKTPINKTPINKGSLKKKQKKSPTVNTDSTEGRWARFLSRWKYYKMGCGIKDNEFHIELLECCEEELKSDLFRNTGGGSMTNLTRSSSLLRWSSSQCGLRTPSLFFGDTTLQCTKSHGLLYLKY